MWKLYSNTDSAISKRVRNLSEQCRTYPLFIQILLNREYSDNDIVSMLTNPMELINSQKPLTNENAAAEKIYEHLLNDNSILVFADYDCDGITSGYVMTDGIRKIRDKIGSKSTVIVYYPERSEGYGLSSNVVDKCLKQDINLVITVDNGISAHEQTKKLVSNGIDVIITDHHPLVGEDNIPRKNTIVVNPKYFIADKDRNYLAGVGVAWNVIRALGHVAILKKRIKDFNPYNYIDAVALGTMADVMPMSPENVAMIQSGLYCINNIDSTNPMFKEYHSDIPVSFKDLSWKIAPDVNSAGRMGNVWIAADAIFNSQNTKEATAKLKRLNYKRRKLTDEVIEGFIKTEYDDKKRFISYNVNNNEASGIVGIVAGKMANKYSLYPCYAYIESDGILRGSVRCEIDIPLHDILKKAQDKNLIIGFAGHNTACVLTVEKDKLNNLTSFISREYDKLNIQNNDNIIYADAIVNLNIVSEPNMQVFNMIPYNDDPKFIINNLIVSEYKQTASGGGFIKISDETASKRVFVYSDVYSKLLALGSPKMINVIGMIEQDFMSKKIKATLKIIDVEKAIL